MLRSIKLIPVVNYTVRNVLRILWRMNGKLASTVNKWDISGTVNLSVSGESIKLHSKCDDQITRNFYYGLPWESAELRLWKILASRASIILDIGANVGVYSILANRHNPNSKVFSFEPNPVNAKRLKHNLTINFQSIDRVVEMAMGSKKEKITFTVPETDQISLVSSAVGDFSKSFFGIEYKTIEVDQTTLDDFVSEQKIPNIDLIKLDVEYYEESVLNGANAVLSDTSPVIICEIFIYDVLAGDKPDSALVDKLSKEQAQNIEKLFQKNGYSFYMIGQRGLLRVDSLMSTPDGARNYLFSKIRSNSLYIPYNDKPQVLNLMSKHI